MSLGRGERFCPRPQLPFGAALLQCVLGVAVSLQVAPRSVCFSPTSQRKGTNATLWVCVGACFLCTCL